MADLRPVMQPMTSAGRPELRAVYGAGEPKLKVEDLTFYYGKNQALHNVSFEIPEKRITAIIGPSGCGKSPLLRVFNRMYDLIPSSRPVSQLLLDGPTTPPTTNLLQLPHTAGNRLHT